MSQTTFGEFSEKSGDSTDADPFDFDDFGPTSRRPDPEPDRPHLRHGTAPLDQLTEWSDRDERQADEHHPSDRDTFEAAMTHTDPTDDTDENRRENAENPRFLPILLTIHQRETDSYTPGQGTALDTVRAIQRKAETRPIDGWSTVEIEATLYNLGHLMSELRLAVGDQVGSNCKHLSTAAESLHQDLIAELQARDRWDADTRQYLTNQFGSICSGIKYGNKPEYTAENCYFEEVQNLTDIGDRLTDIFEDGEGIERCGDCGHHMAAGDWSVCARCANDSVDDQDDGSEDRDDDQDGARSTTRAVADGGETIDAPVDEPEPGDEVLLIENPAVGLNTSPSIVSGEVSGSGKSVMIPVDEGLSNKRRRLDAAEIFAGESEYRDSTSWELYTPGRYRSTQSSNFAPGPQAGSNGKSDIGALPEPTHWPDTDEPADAPDVCPACGEREAPWRDVGKPRCERCGETIDPDADDESDDSGPDKWDLSTLERGDCLILEGHRGEFVVTGINYFQGTHTVSTVDVARRDGSEWNEYTLQKVTRSGDERLKVNTDGQPSVAINVDDPGHAQDFEVIGNDEEKLRRYIREGYYGE